MRTAARLALIGILAVTGAAAWTGSASADLLGVGVATFTIDDGTPCTDTGFKWKDEDEVGVPPISGQEILLSDFTPTGSCATPIVDSEGAVDFESDHSVNPSGNVVFKVGAGLFGTCEYLAVLDGTWGTPLPSGKLVELNGFASRQAGPLYICPDYVSIEIEVDSFSPVT